MDEKQWGTANMKKDLRICAKTGMPLDKPTRHRHMMWYFPVIGLAALAWFLIRVLPKPSRAAYPCQPPLGFHHGEDGAHGHKGRDGTREQQCGHIGYQRVVRKVQRQPVE